MATAKYCYRATRSGKTPVVKTKLGFGGQNLQLQTRETAIFAQVYNKSFVRRFAIDPVFTICRAILGCITGSVDRAVLAAAEKLYLEGKCAG